MTSFANAAMLLAAALILSAALADVRSLSVAADARRGDDERHARRMEESRKREIRLQAEAIANQERLLKLQRGE